jgi:hypothetical protein
MTRVGMGGRVALADCNVLLVPAGQALDAFDAVAVVSGRAVAVLANSAVRTIELMATRPIRRAPRRASGDVRGLENAERF